MSLGFSIFEIFFCLSYLSFSFLFAAVIDLLLLLLAVKKTSKKASSGRAIFTMKQPGVVAGNFALTFSRNFLSISVGISVPLGQSQGDHSMCSCLRREFMRIMNKALKIAHLNHVFSIKLNETLIDSCTVWCFFAFLGWAKGIQGMQTVSNLPISAWLPLADPNGGKTAAGCRGKPSTDW